MGFWDISLVAIIWYSAVIVPDSQNTMHRLSHTPYIKISQAKYDHSQQMPREKDLSQDLSFLQLYLSYVHSSFASFPKQLTNRKTNSMASRTAIIIDMAGQKWNHSTIYNSTTYDIGFRKIKVLYKDYQVAYQFLSKSLLTLSKEKCWILFK